MTFHGFLISSLIMLSVLALAFGIGLALGLFDDPHSNRWDDDDDMGGAA